MMKTVLFVLLAFLVACVLSQDAQPGDNNPIAQFTGTTTGAATFNAPDFTTGTCQPASTSRTYVAFNVSFATAGTRQVIALAEATFRTTIAVFIYQGGFAPSTPCTNFQRQLINTNVVAATNPLILSVDAPFNFAASTVYTIVVTGSAAGQSGRFALNVLPSVAFGTTVGSTLTWTAPNPGNPTCTPDSDTWNLAVLKFTVPATTNGIDILVIADAAVATNAVRWAIYEGDVTAAAISANPCDASLRYKFAASEGDFTAVAYRQVPAALIPTNTYTIAVGVRTPAAIALQVSTTRLVPMNSGTFVQPSLTLPCTASALAASSYYQTNFQAEFSQYLFATYPIPSYLGLTTFSANGFAYQGSNTNQQTCPTGATLIAAAATDSLTGANQSPLVFNTENAQSYSVIFANSAGAQTPSAYILVLRLTGTLVGPGAVTPAPTVIPTGTPAPNNTVSPATTGARATTGGSQTTNAGLTTTTSGASSLFFSFSALLVACFAALL